MMAMPRPEQNLGVSSFSKQLSNKHFWGGEEVGGRILVLVGPAHELVRPSLERATWAVVGFVALLMIQQQIPLIAYPSATNIEEYLGNNP